MVDTRRTLAAIQLLLADNTSGAISPQDMRDAIESSYPDVQNIKNHGAVGDNATDDSAAIQSAIDVGRGIVFIPNGTYRVESVLDIKTGVHLVGEGRDATFIDGGDTSNVLRANGTSGTPVSHSSIRNIAIQNAAVGFTATYWHNSLLFNVDFISCTSHGVDMSNSFGSSMIDTFSRDNGGRGYLFSTACNALSMVHCFAGGNTSHGIEITDAASINIIGVDVEDNGGYGVVLAGIWSGNLTGYFETNGKTNDAGEKVQVVLQASALPRDTRGFVVGPVYVQGTDTSETGVRFGAADDCKLSAGSYFTGHTTRSVQTTSDSVRTLIENFFSDDATKVTDGSATTLYESLAPAGVAAISVTASPFTYTNADGVREAVYITGGTVSDIAKNSTTIFGATEATVWLEPNEAVVVTYSSAPTMNKDRK